MTAFARVQTKAAWGSGTWEIKSVNQRFLEPFFRLPEAFRHLEIPLRERLRKKLGRGKLDCSLRLELSETAGGELSVDQVLATQLISAHRQLQQLADSEQSCSLSTLLRWPGLLKAPEVDTEVIEAELLAAFDEAIAELIAVRQREGEAMAAIIAERLEGIEQQVAVVRQQMPEAIAWQRERILKRFEEAKVELEPERLEQEMVLLAQKVDVAEELDRLGTHVTEVRRLLARGGAVGRRLDFLMQELNREANTLGSKSISATITSASVELKVLIEQMREQIQNIE